MMVSKILSLEIMANDLTLTERLTITFTILRDVHRPKRQFDLSIYHRNRKWELFSSLNDSTCSHFSLRQLQLKQPFFHKSTIFLWHAYQKNFILSIRAALQTRCNFTCPVFIPFLKVFNLAFETLTSKPEMYLLSNLLCKRSNDLWVLQKEIRFASLRKNFTFRVTRKLLKSRIINNVLIFCQQCSKTCDYSVRIRSVHCIDDTGKEVSDRYCSKSRTPRKQQACFGGPCPAKWIAQPWSEVSYLPLSTPHDFIPLISA